MAAGCRIAQRRVSLGDPHDCTDATDQLTILRALCDTLVTRAGQGFGPGLATGWDVSADARRWRFALRAHHRFHDGAPCDATAVAQSLRRMARPDKGYTLGAPGVWRQYLGDARIEPVDDVTLSIDLAEPLADLPDILEHGFIVAPDCLARWDRGEDAEIVGSGPYRVTRRTQDMVAAARVPGHFADAPHDEVTWIAAPDADARFAMLRDGTVDVANDLAARDAGGAAITLHDYLSPVAIIFLLNAARGPLADPRLRRALGLAIDRQRIVDEVLSGRARPLHGFVSPVHFGAPPAEPMPHDPALARSLIADAGLAGGLVLGVDCPSSLPDEAQRLTQALRDQLAEVGVTLDVHVHTQREDYAHMVRRKEIRDMCVFDSSPLSTFRVLHEKIDARVAGSWWQGYRNTRVEDLLDAARREVGDTVRATHYARAYAELQEDPPWLTLYNPARTIGLAGSHPGFAMPADGIIDVTALPRVLSSAPRPA
ncbi:ABC transporter substrate-binding protein [Roseibacterium sp. SDUM158017]|uniref:ABC transporter substrate-binding protein n=1 Tax=Roseicyclus salinarum TaxID=3036773 RepID=UPI0024157A57|nr:ABC transporter substrate-binding protein [Roseibacterium sp. SDUM158017]MDG4650328.1 ABC transporter substrate-binding protein [Roseibacterium sp. SDUM158017]